MKKQTNKIKQQPLLYIQTITHSNVDVPMQSKFEIDVRKRPVKKKHHGEEIEENKQVNLEEMTKVKSDHEQMKKKKSFHLLSLEEKIHYLIELTPDTPKKMCNIVTDEREYVGKIVGYQNEIVEVEAPNTESSIFLTIQELKELHVIGI